MPSFLDTAKNNIYVELGEQVHVVRPLSNKPVCIWQHKIPGIKHTNALGQMIDVRKFSFEVCASTGRGGAGCWLCQNQDPFWTRLEQKDQFTQKGKRSDFGRSPVYLMPVYDHTAMEVRILRGPASLYAEMDKWHELGRDIRECDWSVQKTGKGLMTKYPSTRHDSSTFAATDEMLARAEDLVKQSHSQDFTPSDPDYIKRMVNGQSDSAAPAANALPTGHFGLPTPEVIRHTANVLPPPPPPSMAVGLANPIQKDPSGHWVLLSNNTWMAVTEAREKSLPGAEAL